MAALLTMKDFFTHIKKHGVARPNKYDIIFDLPPAIFDIIKEDGFDNSVGAPGAPTGTGNKAGITKDMALSCLSIDMPTRAVSTTNIDYGSWERKVATGRVSGEFTTTFVLTGTMNEKLVFDAWMLLIADDNHRVGYYDDYITNFSISVYDNALDEMYAAQITEVYPVSVGAIRLDKTSMNTQMLLDVTWAYYRYIPKTSFDLTVIPNSLINSQTPGFISEEAKRLNIPDVPARSFAIIQANDIIKALRRVQNAVKSGDMTIASGIALTRQLLRDFNALQGIPGGVIEDVLKIGQDVLQGMPIPVPGIPGGIPQRLPL